MSSLLKYFQPSKEKQIVDISDYLEEELVFFMEAKNREEALRFLVHQLDQQGKLKNQKMFHQAILEREKIVSTGIGMGVAIPHAKMEGFQNFFITVGIQKNKGIEWDSLDYSPVQFVFMIGGPDNRQTEYIRILSSLTYSIKNELLRKNLLLAKTCKEALQLLKDPPR